MTNKDKVELQNSWMIRDCSDYKDEYSNCSGIKDRFHQYFVYGHTIDCTQWKTDYNNCKKWINTNDNEAFEELVNSEIKRRRERLTPHVQNDVWTKRDAPPESWAHPLPDWMQEKHQYTYLYQKSLENKEKISSEPKTACNIL